MAAATGVTDESVATGSKASDRMLRQIRHGLTGDQRSLLPTAPRSGRLLTLLNGPQAGSTLDRSFSGHRLSQAQIRYSALLDQTESAVFIMATNVTAGMTLLMRHRGHRWPSVTRPGQPH